MVKILFTPCGYYIRRAKIGFLNHETNTMSAQIIDGKAIDADVRNQVRLDIEQRTKNNQRAPGLAVILVGQNPASQVYVRKKREACD
ncbi:MAG: hypothetical protein COB05_06355, partial [Marinobacter sp.]